PPARHQPKTSNGTESYPGLVARELIPAGFSHYRMNGSREVSMQGVTVHIREHRSVLAAVEKRALLWLAARMPRWVTSDHLTLLGLVSMIAAGVAFAAVRFTPWSVVGV